MPNHFNRQRAAEVLVDAHFLGITRAAAKWGIVDRTVQNYRARLASDLELTALFTQLRQRAQTEWHDERLKFLKSALAKLDQLVAIADSAKDIPAVANAVKVVGELQVAEDVLGGGHRADQQGEVAGAPPGDDAPGDDGSAEGSSDDH